MRLSVCMIARNEERNLPRALDSVREVADEIVVVDTGSKDETRQIATRMKARVFEQPWQDDFAAARNFAFQQARGEWILLLDADEEVLPESAGPLADALSDDGAIAFNVLRQDLKAADDLHSYTEMWQQRLFRRRMAPPQIGRCHPRFSPSLEELGSARGLAVKESKIRLRHYGYVAELKRKKLERSAKLLAMELKDRPGQIYYRIELGMCLLMLGDPTGHQVLLEVGREVLGLSEAPAAPTALTGPLFEYLLSLPAERLPEGWSPELLGNLAEKWVPHAAPVLWIAAGRSYRNGDFESAKLKLERLLEMGRDETYDRSTSFNPDIVGDEAKLNLGAVCLKLAKIDEAEKIFRELLSTKFQTQASANLAAIDRIRATLGSGV